MNSQRHRLCRARVLLLGTEGVGKTAFAVRYLTKRFIGEYDSNKEMLYTHKVSVDKDEVCMEILDTAHTMDDATLEGHLRWADAFIYVYSITDKTSYRKADLFYTRLRRLRATLPDFGHIPSVIIANKTDLTCARKVSEAEGHELASRFSCPVYELSIAESADDVTEVMNEVVRRIRREHVRAQNNGAEKRTTLRGVKRVLRKKISRSKSDTGP